MLGNRAEDEKWFDDTFLFCCSPRRRDRLAPREVQGMRIPPRGIPGHFESTESERCSAGDEAPKNSAGYLRVRSFSAQKGYHWTKIAVSQADAREAAPFPAGPATSDKKGPKVLSLPGSGHQRSAKEIGTFDELSATAASEFKHPPIADPIVSPPPSSVVRLGSTGLVGNSWIVEDYKLGGVMNLEEIIPTNTLWITACDGEASDPFVVTVPSAVQSVSIFKCSNLVVKCISTESVLFQDCSATTVELKTCPQESPPFASWDRCRACILLTKDGTPASSFKRRTVCVSSSEISVVDSQGDEYEVKSQEDAVPAHASRSGPRPTPTPAPRPSLKGVGKAHKAKLPARHLGVLASFEDLSGVANEVAKEDATGNAPATESEAGKGAPGDISPREDVAPAQKIIPTYPASMPEPSPPPVTPQDPTPRQRDSELDEVYRPLDIASMNLTRSYPLVASPPSSNSTPSAVAQPDTAAAAANPPDQARIGATPPVLL